MPDCVIPHLMRDPEAEFAGRILDPRVKPEDDKRSCFHRITETTLAVILTSNQSNMEQTQEKHEQHGEHARPAASGSTGHAAALGAAFMVMITVVGLFYVFVTRNQISTDKADIEAPSIVVSSPPGGTLEAMLVAPGDIVAADTPVAEVGNQVLRTDRPGLVIDAPDMVGKTITPNEPVVTLIDPASLRVVAHIDEDKGLSDIRTGQLVTFTVDAFGSKQYTGVVSEIIPTSRQSGVVFNISDQREVRQFDVKIRFDVAKYPELRNGMSAKVTIFKK